MPLKQRRHLFLYMKHAAQYIKTAVQLIEEYIGAVPLHHYLKSRFSNEKKYGSKDRRYISHLCYAYFRLGHFLKDISAEDRIKAALFLSGSQEWKVLFAEDGLSYWDNDTEKRATFIQDEYQQSISAIFPWQEEVSDEIDKQAFNLSHLIQPDLFIRIRPGKEKLVKEKLNKANVPFRQITNSCLVFENGTKLENILHLNRDYVVQDLSSQRVGEFLSLVNCHPSTGLPSTGNYHSSTKVWDCCAASGGKSIMAYDLFPEIELTVSDIRPSIIHNLNNRLTEAGIKNYHSFVADLSPNPKGRREGSPVPKGRREKSGILSSQHINQSTNQLFDLIICDAPCSGSGTWGRTPEQLYFFKPGEITRYSDLQKKITSNVIPFIKKDGHLLYITCSVFKKENEEVVGFIQKQFGLTLVKMELLKGYGKKADTLFAALFTS